ncbi:MAG: cytochrome c3 family protein [Candidatus Binatia bacterium]
MWRSRYYDAGAVLLLLLAVALTGSVALCQENAVCLSCHGESTLTRVSKSGKEISLYVDPSAFKASVHGVFSCVNCHVDATKIPHAQKLKPVNCGLCHEGPVTALARGVHGKARQRGVADAPTCSDCHGKHDILPSPNPASRTHPLHVALTCAQCHSDPSFVRRHSIPIPDPLAAYRASVHGIAVMSERDFKAATCVSCHGSHDIRNNEDPESSIYWQNVSGTCGNCHREVLRQYSQSVHGQAVKRGVRDAPTCIDCHGEHRVQSPRQRTSPVNPLNVSTETCGRCHASKRINSKYGLPAGRLKTFERSYHGLALRAGEVEVANCASCHGIHNILPSSDPRSTIFPANLPQTCGQCHRNVSEKVAVGPVHLTTSSTPGRIVYWVRRLYIWLIAGVIALMAIHNGLDFIRRARRILTRRAGPESPGRSSDTGNRG